MAEIGVGFGGVAGRLPDLCPKRASKWSAALDLAYDHEIDPEDLGASLRSRAGSMERRRNGSRFAPGSGINVVKSEKIDWRNAIGSKLTACIEHAAGPGILVDDRNVQKATLLHDRPDIVQRVVGVTTGDIPRHHCCGLNRASASLALTDPTYDVRLGHDVDDRPVGSADNHEIDFRAAQERGCLREQGTGVDRNQALACLASNLSTNIE